MRHQRFIKTALVLASALFINSSLVAQTEGVIISNTNDTPEPTAILEVKSTSKGVLLPRMTSSQKDALELTGVQGLTVFVTTAGPDYGYWYHNGTNFTKVGEGLWKRSTAVNNNIYFDTGKVGIGINNPTAQLDIKANIANVDVMHLEGVQITNTDNLTVSRGELTYRHAPGPYSELINVGKADGAARFTQKVQIDGSGGPGTGSIEDGFMLTTFGAANSHPWTVMGNPSGQLYVGAGAGYPLIFIPDGTHGGNFVASCNNDNWTFHREVNFVASQQFSDQELKKDIIDYTKKVIPGIKQLQVKNYRWKDESISKDVKLGLIAQDIAKQFPELVVEKRILMDMLEGKEPNYQIIQTIDTYALSTILLKALQEQQATIESLESRIAVLEKK